MICHPKGIEGRGSGNVMVITAAPSKSEGLLSGESGNLFNTVYNSVGNTESYYITSLVCTPKEEPTNEQIVECFPRLLKEISVLKPKLIILLGKIVCETIIQRPLSGKRGARGAVIWSDIFNCYVLPSYSPNVIIRGVNDRFSKDNKEANYIYDLSRDLTKVHRVLEWEPNSPFAQVTYTVLNTQEELQTALNNLDGVVAFDVETMNPNLDELDVYGDVLMCFGISDGVSTYVASKELCQSLIKQNNVLWPDLQWTFHNAQFDTGIIRKNLGMWLDVYEDTMLQSYSLDERSGLHGLKPLAREYLGAGWWEEERQKGKERLQDLPENTLYEYNAKDAAYTARLCMLFTTFQLADNVRDMYLETLIPLVNAVKDIQYRGFRIDRKLHMQFAIEWGQKYLDLEADLQQKAYDIGWPKDSLPINLQSPQQVSTMIFRIIGIPIGKLTKSGNPSTAMDYLEELSGINDWVDLFITFRHLARFYDTYITGLANHFKGDGRVHAYVKIHGTKTGRLSYSGPPLQTIPQTYEKKGVAPYLRRIREVFIPDKNHVILEVDYGKGEIWMAQAHSKDRQMLEDLQSGDYHSVVASNVMHKPLSEVTKADRLIMKTVTFGVMYGREAKALSKVIETTTLEAQIYIANFFKRYPVYAAYYKSIEQEVDRAWELRSVTGRKRRFFILGSAVRIHKQAVNYPIQSALGDLTAKALVVLHNKLKELKLRARILVQVHDSLVLTVHRDDFQQVQQLVHDIMTASYWKSFPRLPVEMSSGDNWGTTKGFHDCMEIGCLKEEV